MHAEDDTSPSLGREPPGKRKPPTVAREGHLSTLGSPPLAFHRLTAFPGEQTRNQEERRVPPNVEFVSRSFRHLLTMLNKGVSTAQRSVRSCSEGPRCGVTSCAGGG